MKYINKIVYGSILTLLLSSSSYADCSYELFTISSTKDTKIIDFVEQLSDECEFSVIVTDPNAEKFLESKLNKTHLKNLTIDEVLSVILKENNLYYTLESNILRISYLKTEIFGIDYILSQRTGKGKVNVSLSSTSNSGGNTGAGAGATGGGNNAGGSTAETGIIIESTDEVKFWTDLDKELQSVINRPHDVYKADAPIINKNAGLITVTATTKQMDRFTNYLKKLQEKVQLQVLIDVQLLSVSLNEGQSTGIDWSQLYALQNFEVSINGSGNTNSSNRRTTNGGVMTAVSDTFKNITGMVNITGGAKLKEVIKFLKTQGDVVSISNPKVLTLNNQPALITAGTEYFYKLESSESVAGGGEAVVGQTDIIESVFAGVLLSITPEIADDKTITLKINPSLSETAQEMDTGDSGDRVMPPDLNRRQLSSVVTVKDGHRIILGGLINTKNTTDVNKVPLLGDIPGLSYLFKYENIKKQVQELVIIIEPHIIDKANSDFSLADLGYKGVTDETVILNKSSVVDQDLELQQRTEKAINKL